MNITVRLAAFLFASVFAVPAAPAIGQDEEEEPKKPTGFQTSDKVFEFGPNGFTRGNSTKDAGTGKVVTNYSRKAGSKGSVLIVTELPVKTGNLDKWDEAIHAYYTSSPDAEDENQKGLGYELKSKHEDFNKEDKEFSVAGTIKAYRHMWKVPMQDKEGNAFTVPMEDVIFLYQVKSKWKAYFFEIYADPKENNNVFNSIKLAGAGTGDGETAPAAKNIVIYKVEFAHPSKTWKKTEKNKSSFYVFEILSGRNTVARITALVDPQMKVKDEETGETKDLVLDPKTYAELLEKSGAPRSEEAPDSEITDAITGKKGEWGDHVNEGGQHSFFAFYKLGGKWHLLLFEYIPDSAKYVADWKTLIRSVQTKK